MKKRTLQIALFNLKEKTNRILHILRLRTHQVDFDTLEISGVDSADYPKFCDAYFEKGYFDDGTELNDEELSNLTDEHGDLANEMAFESLL